MYCLIQFKIDKSQNLTPIINKTNIYYLDSIRNQFAYIVKKIKVFFAWNYLL